MSDPGAESEPEAPLGSRPRSGQSGPAVILEHRVCRVRLTKNMPTARTSTMAALPLREAARLLRHVPKAMRRVGLSLALPFAIAATPALGGCAATTPDADTAAKLNLPRWDGQLRELFPNEIDPAALGLGAAKAVSRTDRTLWARATTSDVVGRARVQTVTVDTRIGVDTYRIGIEFATPTLATPKTTESTFELTIAPSDPAYGMVKALDNRLQGKTFVAFVKRFAGADDEIEVHFYLSPDSADVAKVIQEAVAVQEVSHQ